MYGEFEFRPRNGHTLETLAVARISDCQNQKDVSLEDQIDHGREILEGGWDGPINVREFSTKGKGEWLDRKELAEIEKLLRTRTLDVMVIEDIGRLIRGPAAVRLLGIGVDHGVRTISPHDGIDTDEDNWEEDAVSASRDHVANQSHTSKRLKFKLMNRFLKKIGATPLETVAYEVPETAKTFDDWKKNPVVEEKILEGFALLSTCLNCSKVADWFNDKKVPVGPNCRRSTWNGAMVRRLYKNPTLKGTPGRGFKVTAKHFESGRRRSVPNPKGPQFVSFPHLAYFSASEFDDLNARLDQKNAKLGRKHEDGRDPLQGIPRKRTRFPGQHARCWYCGRHYVWGGNGMVDNLMCSGAREWKCWNSIGFDGGLISEKLVHATVEHLRHLKGFEDQFAAMVAASRSAPDAERQDRQRRCEQERLALERDKKAFLDAVRAFGDRPILAEELTKIEDRERTLQRVFEDLARPAPRVAMPNNVAEIGCRVEEEFTRLATSSYEFGDKMQQFAPHVSIYLVRLCDGGHLLPRARVRLNVAGSIPGIEQYPALHSFFAHDLTIDLFDLPQREAIRPEVIRIVAAAALAEKPLPTHKQIAAQVEGRPTATAVGNAIALNRRMRELGLTSPYVFAPAPPPDYTKLRRHLNAKYHFSPLEGHIPPSL